MKEQLQDIVAHTQTLNYIDTVKIVGTNDQTSVNTVSDDRSIILDAEFKNPIPEFIGTFGMPNLDKLKTILNITEYNTNPKLEIITQKRNGVNEPAGIHFENEAGDFKNDYRFMDSNSINTKIKSLKMKNVTWNIDLIPEVASITRLKYQAAANSEETTFTVKTVNGDLKFFFGDAASHSGNFVFQANVTGKLTKEWNWPVAPIISIFNLGGNKTLKISDDGVLEITVDSGIAEYTYKLPAHQK